MKTNPFVLVFAVLLFANLNYTFGQICPESLCIVNSSETGEVASAAIDSIIVKAVKSGERIFVIARFGTQDTIPRNLSRLCEARDYILSRFSGERGRYRDYFDSSPPVFAEGAGIEGEGRLEFYLGSKLQLIRIIERNRGANLDCCGELSSKERKQKQEECKNWKEKGVIKSN